MRGVRSEALAPCLSVATLWAQWQECYPYLSSSAVCVTLPWLGLPCDGKIWPVCHLDVLPLKSCAVVLLRSLQSLNERQHMLLGGDCLTLAQWLAATMGCTVLGSEETPLQNLLLAADPCPRMQTLARAQVAHICKCMHVHPHYTCARARVHRHAYTIATPALWAAYTFPCSSDICTFTYAYSDLTCDCKQMRGSVHVRMRSEEWRRRQCLSQREQSLLRNPCIAQQSLTSCCQEAVNSAWPTQLS